MRIEILRTIERRLKGRLNLLRLKQKDFTIISNNCWGTFIYKKFDLPYQSPFVNLFIFAEDYIRLVENFSPEILNNIHFITHQESKHIDELKSRGHYNLPYPIGIIGDGIEIHFLHYTQEDDAREKWNDRIKRINYEMLLFKFSDSEICKDSLVERFDQLPFKNKICFTAKPFPKLKSVVYLKHFKGTTRVRDEWKHSDREYSIFNLLNNL